MSYALTFAALGLLVLPTCLAKLVFLETVRAAKPFLDFHELHNVNPLDMVQRTGSLQFEHKSEAGTVRLNYDAELAESAHIVRLDSDGTVTALDCSLLFGAADEGELKLYMRSLADVDMLRTGSFISGSSHWGCSNHGEPTSILHQVVTTPLVLSSAHPAAADLLEVIVRVRTAQYTDMFKHASIEFYTDRYPENHFVTHDHSGDSLQDAARHGRYSMQERALPNASKPVDGAGDDSDVIGNRFSSFLSSTWRRVQTIASTVQTAVNTVATIVQGLDTGNLAFNQTLSTGGWLYNTDSAGRIVTPQVLIDESMNCVNCGATAQYSILFTLTITNSQLVALRVVASGSFASQASMEGSWSRQLLRNASRIITTVNMQPITIRVMGLPVTIRTMVPITLGYELQVDANVALSARAAASGSFQYGVGFASGRMFLINQQSFAYSGAFTRMVAGVTAAARIYVLPTVQIRVDFVGGPNVGFEPFVEANVQVSTDRSNPCSRVGGVNAAAAFGLQITVGAVLNITALGISLWSRNFPPVAVFSTKRPILSGCMSLTGATTQTNSGLELVSFPANRSSSEHPLLRTLPTTPEAMAALAALTATQPLQVLFPVTGAPGLFRSGAGNQNDVGCAPGTTWSGTMVRGTSTNAECNAYPPFRFISMQAVLTELTSNGFFMEVILSVSDANSGVAQSFACVFQQRWLISYYTSRNQFVFGPIGTSQADVYSRCSGDFAPNQCSCAGSATTLPQRMSGTITNNFMNVVIEDSQLCTRTVMTRVVQGTTGQYYLDNQDNATAAATNAAACGG